MESSKSINIHAIGESLQASTQSAIGDVLEALDILTRESPLAYPLLAFHTIVLFWRVAAPFFRVGLRSNAIAGLHKCLGALVAIAASPQVDDGMVQRWKARLSMALSLAHKEAGDEKSAVSVSSAIDPPANLNQAVEALQVHLKGKGSVAEVQAAWKAGSLSRAVSIAHSLDNSALSKEIEQMVQQLLQLDSFSADQLSALSALADLASQRGLLQLAETAVGGMPRGPHRADIEIKLSFARARLRVGSAKGEKTLAAARRVDALKIAVKGRRQMRCCSLPFSNFNVPMPALESAKRIEAAELVEEGCMLVWNVALGLLEDGLRKHARQALEVAANALDAVKSPNLDLLARLRLELAQCQVAEDFFMKAASNVDKVLALDYAAEDQRTLDHRASILKSRIDLRRNLYQEPEDPVDQATLLLEQAKDAADAHLCESLLSRAAKIMQSVDGPDAFEAVQIWLEAATAAWTFKLVDLVDIATEQVVSLGEGLAREEPLVARMLIRAMGMKIEMLAHRVRTDESCAGEAKRLGVRVEGEGEAVARWKKELVAESRKMIKISRELHLPWALQNALVYFWNYHVDVFEGGNTLPVIPCLRLALQEAFDVVIADNENDENAEIPIDMRCKLALAMAIDCEAQGDVSRAVDLLQSFLQRVPPSLASVDLHRAIYRMRPTQALPPPPSPTNPCPIAVHTYVASCTELLRSTPSPSPHSKQMAESAQAVIISAIPHLTTEAAAERLVALAEAALHVAEPSVAQACCNAVPRAGKWGCLAGCLAGRIFQERLNPSRQSLEAQERVLREALDALTSALGCALETGKAVLVEYAARVMYNLGMKHVGCGGSRSAVARGFEAALEALERFKGTDEELRGKMLLVVLNALKDDGEWGRGMAIAEAKLGKLKLPPAVRRPLWELAVVFSCKLGRDPSSAIHNLHHSDEQEMADLWITVAQSSATTPEQLSAHINAVNAVEKAKRRHPQAYARALLHLARWEYMNDFDRNEIRCILLAAVDALNAPREVPSGVSQRRLSSGGSSEQDNSLLQAQLAKLMVIRMLAEIAQEHRQQAGLLHVANESLDAAWQCFPEGVSLELFAQAGLVWGTSAGKVPQLDITDDPAMPCFPALIALAELFRAHWMLPSALKLLLLLLLLQPEHRTDIAALIMLKVAAIHADLGNEELRLAWAKEAYCKLPSERERSSLRKELARLEVSSSSQGKKSKESPDPAPRRRESGNEPRRVWLMIAEELLRVGRLKECETLLTEAARHNAVHGDHFGKIREIRIHAEMNRLQGDAARCISTLLQILSFPPQQLELPEAHAATLALIDVLRSQDRHHDIALLITRALAAPCSKDDSLATSAFRSLLRLEHLRGLLASRAEIQPHLRPALIGILLAGIGPLLTAGARRVEAFAEEALRAVEQGCLRSECLSSLRTEMPVFLREVTRGISAQMSVVRGLYTFAEMPTATLPFSDVFSRLQVLSASFAFTQDSRGEGMEETKEGVVEEWLRRTEPVKVVGGSVKVWKGLSLAGCAVSDEALAPVYAGRALAAVGDAEGLRLLEEACRSCGEDWRALEAASADLFTLAKEGAEEGVASHAVLRMQSAMVSDELYRMVTRIGGRGKLGLCHRLRDRRQEAERLLKQSDVFKMLQCCVEVAPTVSRICTEFDCRILSLCYSSRLSRVFATAAAADQQGQICYGSTSAHVSHAAMTQLIEQMGDLRVDMREWMVDYANDHGTEGEFKGHEVEDRTEGAVKQLLGKLELMFRQVIGDLKHIIYAEQREDSKPRLVILCDHSLSALPIDSLVDVGEFISVSRELGIGVMAAKMAQTDNPTPCKSIRYVADPKKEDASGTIEETLLSLRKRQDVAWNGLSGEARELGEADFQQSLVGNGDQAEPHGFLFLGLSRMLAYVRPSSLVELNLRNCRFALCIDRSPNDHNLAGQIKADNKKATNDLAMEDPHITAALLSTLGIRDVVLFQWSGLLDTHCRMATEILDDTDGKGIPIAQRLTDFLQRDDFKDRVKFNAVHYGLPWSAF